MTALNLSLLDAFDLVRYFRPSNDTEDALYQALITEEYKHQDLELELEALTEKISDLEKELKQLEDDYEDKLDKLKDENFELSEKIAELEKESEK